MSRGLTAEMIAAVAKLMSNLDLIYAAKKIRVTAHCNTTIGLPGTLSCCLQPNHPTDDPDGIMASLLEGLTFGAGDAVLGLNPVDDSVESVRRVLDRFQEIKTRWDIPTQICVLAHVTTQMEAVRQGAPCDLIFQSIAGSQKGNEAFGLDGKLIEEARQLALREGAATGPNVMYFETGQGSELSSEAHHGADQVVMEARCYGFAKRFQPFLVNTVVGFIGPEYLYNSKQVIRAGLEDHFMGKLTGIPMGCDACYTNHMKADQNDIEDLAVLLTAAGCNYFMGIPHGDDVMLNYQTTGFHETAALRELYGLTAIPPFQAWLDEDGLRGERKADRAGGGCVRSAGVNRRPTRAPCRRGLAPAEGGASMLILVSGGSASGKSEFAEGLVAASGLETRAYLATMQVWDAESERRVERHRRMRAGKGFATVECPVNLAGAVLPAGCAALLEDLSNLTANEFFGPQGREGAFGRVLSGVERAAEQAALLVVVTNELFSDGMDYDPETLAYLDVLARLNRAVAQRADRVYEVVCGIPIAWKGANP